jgi:hypothetical protein
MRRGTVLVSAVVVLLVGAPGARAEDVDAVDVLTAEAEMLAEQLHRRLDMVSLGDYSTGEFLTTGLDADMDMIIDIHKRRARAHVRLGGGDDRVLALRIDARIALDRGMPRIKGQLDVGIAGKRISISLPEITVVPRSYEGEIYLQYNIPLIEGRF